MKILHINSYYSGSNFYKNLYDKQKEYGVVIDVYVPVSKAIDTTKLSLGDYTTISVNHNKYDRLFFKVKHNKIYKDIINTYSINNYSIIHAHSLFSNGYIAMMLKQKYDIPYVVAVRNTDVNVFFKRMIHLRGLGIKILKGAEKIIFISESYKKITIDRFIPEKYKKEIEGKSIVIPNGIDEFWLKNKHKKSTDFEKYKIGLLYVGRVDSNKNIETTIKACELLIKQGYKVNYKIIGKLIDSKYNNIINKYLFIDYIPHCGKEELINHYRASDIFVMPSKNETFGLVYVEAMSQGLPVIYSSGQGFDGQFLDGEVGCSVKYNSEKQIVNRIHEIFKKYEAISRSCYNKVDRFNWDGIAKEYVVIYENINFKKETK